MDNDSNDSRQNLEVVNGDFDLKHDDPRAKHETHALIRHNNNNNNNFFFFLSINTFHYDSNIIYEDRT